MSAGVPRRSSGDCLASRATVCSSLPSRNSSVAVGRGRADEGAANVGAVQAVKGVEVELGDWRVVHPVGRVDHDVDAAVLRFQPSKSAATAAAYGHADSNPIRSYPGGAAVATSTV